MKITYIHHSSFCVEFEKEKTVLLFDYYIGEIPSFSEDSHVYVFSSHKHYDHYSKKIFELADIYKNITFVLSKEIKMNEKYMNRNDISLELMDKILYVKANDTYELGQDINLIKVQTLKSTDSGVAFVVNCFDKCIYHAGDLNWWIWNGEPEDENVDMTKRFMKEIGKLKDTKFDIAFLPLDPRQEDKFYFGFDYFMKHCNVCVAFPMHLWEKYETINELKKLEEAANYLDKIVTICEEGQEFIIDN